VFQILVVKLIALDSVDVVLVDIETKYVENCDSKSSQSYIFLPESQTSTHKHWHTQAGAHMCSTHTHPAILPHGQHEAQAIMLCLGRVPCIPYKTQ
jgi:hypothetical protein